MSKVIVRAIELGFGTTSCVVSENQGKPIIKTFPSIATKVDVNHLSGLDGHAFAKRKVIQVTVDGIVYEVGDDAGLAGGSLQPRVLNDGYVASDQYKALFKGALSMIHDDIIDILVLGLPVNHWQRKDMLSEFAKGQHIFESLNRTITVKKVLVIPQPLGGLLAYASEPSTGRGEDFSTRTIACIDAGYLTLDLCVSHGLAINERRSMAVNFGFSAVINELKAPLMDAFGLTSISNDIIDAAFWKNKGEIKVKGKRYPFPKCDGKLADGSPTPISFDVSPVIRMVTLNAINEVKNHLSDASDIDVFVCFGGPINIYVPAIAEVFDGHEVNVLSDHLTSVIRGLFVAGKQLASRNLNKPAA